MTQHRVETNKTTVGEVTITPQPAYDKPVYRSECDCGWVGVVYTDRIAADNDGDEHVLQMSRCDD